jgi:GNAT superfamily N-acetyltransferase
MEQARPEDLDVVMGVLNDATAWLHAVGIDYQWKYPLPQSSWDRTARGLDHGETFLARGPDGRAIGTLRLEWTDKYGAWPVAPDVAGYMRSLATTANVRGTGIGAILVRWACQQAADRERRYLRLRCCGENPVLCRFYEGLGFQLRGHVQEKAWAAALYELELESALVYPLGSHKES